MVDRPGAGDQQRARRVSQQPGQPDLGRCGVQLARETLGVCGGSSA
jgi:hypothetical protein